MAWIEFENISPPWFHACSALVDIGTVLLPGNMGRIISLYNKSSSRLQLENDYEEARIEIDDQLPSRLSSIFLCPTIYDAIAFAATDTPKLCQWYEVEPIEPVSKIFATDIRAWAASVDVADNKKAAQIYWTFKTSDTYREILFPAPVRVTNILPPMADIIMDLAKSESERNRLRELGLPF